MSILERHPYSEQRNRGQRKLPIVPAILYLTSIVPALVIGLNFEAFRHAAIRILGGQSTPPAEQPIAAPPIQLPSTTQVAEAQPSEPVKPKAGIWQPAIVKPAKTQPATTQSATAQPARPFEPPVAESPPEPMLRPPLRVAPAIARIAGPSPAADHVLPLKLSHRRQRYPIELRYPGSRLQILPLKDLEDVNVAYEIRPADGTFDDLHPAVIWFQTTNPARIEISLDCAGEGTIATKVCLDFLVNDDDGRSVPFTSTKLADCRRRTVALGRKVESALVSMVAERRQLEALVYSSVPMAYLDLERGEARLVELQSAIPAASERHADLTNQLGALNELTALADSLGGTQLRLREIGGFE